MIFQKSRKKGFSLLELSIVISIMTILAGAVVVGGKISTKVKADSLANEITTYQMMINSFYSTYNAIPGDFKNAEVELSSNTKNGNGNREIDLVNISGVDWHESLLAWEHLYYAKYITKKIIPLPVSQTWVSGINVMNSSAVSDAFFTLATTVRQPVILNAGSYKAGSLFMFLSTVHSAETFATAEIDYAAGVSAEILEMLDIKMDDGLPMTGKVMGINPNTGSVLCNSSANRYNSGNYDAAARYIQSSRNGCVMAYLFDSL